MPRKLVEITYDAEEGLTIKLKPDGLHMMPEPTRQHLLGARKEFLLALRSLVDKGIARIERKEQAARGPRKVEVKEES